MRKSGLYIPFDFSTNCKRWKVSLATSLSKSDRSIRASDLRSRSTKSLNQRSRVTAMLKRLERTISFPTW